MRSEKPKVLVRPRIPNEIRKQCLELFRSGYGYKKTAMTTGLNKYTVREYNRRYKAGDLSWANRGAKTDSRGEKYE